MACAAVRAVTPINTISAAGDEVGGARSATKTKRSNRISIQLKVVAVSSNYNSFGLRNMVFVTDHGQGWQAAANDINVLKRGDIILVPSDGDIGLHLTGFNFEIPSRLTPDPSVELVREAFPE